MKYYNLIKKLLLVLSFAVCSMIIGMICGLLFIKPVYCSEAQYYISENSNNNAVYSSSDLKNIILSDNFYTTVSHKLKNKYATGKLKNMIDIDTDRSSMFFILRVSSEKSSEVFEIHKTIETMINSFVSDSTGEFLSIELVESAVFPKNKHRKGLGLVCLFSTLPGACVAGFMILKNKNNNIISENDIQKLFPVIPVIARIPDYSMVTEKKYISENNSEFSKIFRQITANLHFEQIPANKTTNPVISPVMINKSTKSDFIFAFRDFHTEIKKLSESPKKIILISSSVNGEGKSVIVANLGISMAAEGKKVLIIDANMHNRRLTKAFELSTDLPGLAEVAAGTLEAKEAIMITEYRSLYIMTAGNYSGNPLGLLTRSETLSSIYDLKSIFDYIIIDTPPLNAFPDALALTGVSDQIYLTARSNFTAETSLINCVRSFQLSDIKISGFILNDIQNAENKNDNLKNLYSKEKSHFTTKFHI